VNHSVKFHIFFLGVPSQTSDKQLLGFRGGATIAAQAAKRPKETRDGRAR
jgi:hypothetical protein